MKFTYRIISLLILLCPLSYTQTVDMNEYIKRARALDPKVKSLESVIMSKESSIKQAGKKINPSIELEAGNKEQFIGFFQDVEYPGKIDGRITLAALEKEIAEMELRKYLIVSDLEFAGDYIDWFFANESVKLFGENKNIVNGINKIVEYNFKNGFGSKLDYLKSKVELNKAVRFLAEAEKKSEQLLDKIYQNSKISASEMPQNPKEIEIKGYLSLDECFALAEKHNPDIREARLKIKIADAIKDNIILSAKPDFNLGISAGYEEGSFAAAFKFGMPLNLWDSKKDAVIESEHSAKSSEYDYQSLILNIRKEISGAFIEIKNNRKSISLFENELLKESEEVFIDAKKLFESGELKMLDFLDAERTYLDVRIEYIEVKRALVFSLIRLNAAIGLTVTGN